MNFRKVNKGLPNINPDVPSPDMDIRKKTLPDIWKPTIDSAFIVRANPLTGRIKE